MFYSAITPKSSALLWKIHRLYLKHVPLWFEIVLPDGQTMTIKYLSEGKMNYLFYVQEEERLLRILREQFYNLSGPVKSKEVLRNCELMNSLAEREISISCSPLYGGACLVQNAGKLLKYSRLTDRTGLHDVFTQIEEWSLDNRVVLLDYNENNWCYESGRIRFIDVDANFTCPLSSIRGNEIVNRRVTAAQRIKTDEEALKYFLKEEESLLWHNLRR